MSTLNTLAKSTNPRLSLLYGNAQLDLQAVYIFKQNQAFIPPRSVCLLKDATDIKVALELEPKAIICPFKTQEEARTYLKLCEKARVTLLAMPLSLTVERVYEEAVKCLVKETPLSSSASIQSYLLETLESNKPERELLEKLHKLTRINFILFSTWGSVLAQAGIININPKAIELKEGKHRDNRTDFWVFQIYTKGQKQAILIATELNDRYLSLIMTARQILGLAAAQRQLRLETSSSQKEVLFNEWLLGNPHDLSLRLASYQFDTGIGFLVAIAKLSTKKRQSTNRLIQILEQIKNQGDAYFSTSAIPFLSSKRESHVVWVINTSNTGQLSNLHKTLNTLDASIKVGSSLPSLNYAELSSHYHQAILAADSIHNKAGFASFSKLDPIYWTLQQQPKANLEALRDQLIGSVKKADKSGKLWHTLKSYLQHPGDLNELANSLNVHVNTLRYRLNKIEALIDKPLGRPETLAQLYLAEQIDRMLQNN